MTGIAGHFAIQSIDIPQPRFFVFVLMKARSEQTTVERTIIKTSMAMARFCSQRVCGSERVVRSAVVELLTVTAFASAGAHSHPAAPPIATIAGLRGGDGRSTNPYTQFASSRRASASQAGGCSLRCQCAVR